MSLGPEIKKKRTEECKQMYPYYTRWIEGLSDIEHQIVCEWFRGNHNHKRIAKRYNIRVRIVKNVFMGLKDAIIKSQRRYLIISMHNARCNAIGKPEWKIKI
ncbi:MAG: hypothetical protein KAW92_13705, partial [Candidatus Cloacimonetes bacterium]|nr:hypothetical protein [Candidatus Cloacimonadota bacterium]